MKRSVFARSVGRAAGFYAEPLSTSDAFLQDVLRGLAQAQKKIPPKYFYDARGSELFEVICATPEYYPTRAEMSIMAAHIGDIAASIPRNHMLIELGSGASLKTRLLIQHTQPLAYIPIDVSASALEEACRGLAWRFPTLDIEPLVADFTALRLPKAEGQTRVVYFPGSTIGNFYPDEAADFMRDLHAQLNEGDRLLIGVDLKKDPAILHAAYNDSQGVTAAFNLNLLERINRELGADFDIGNFRHLAFYNAERGWVEMHLQARHAMDVHLAGHRFHFRAEESLHTEISCKYELAEFAALAASAGFVKEAVWTDPDNLFSVFLLQADASA
ncbi:MAG TPA: L-histidine N(alpha)-methyltransferase [Burkholderiales bacterium]|nr:L-histidine N(alpha)-methyltransferase [Burkholderiales bacterium]